MGAVRPIELAGGAGHAGSVAYLLARLAALCGDDSAADELFAEAGRRDEHAGAGALVVRDLQHHGRFLRAVGRSDRADEILTAAAEKHFSRQFSWTSGGGHAR